MGDLLNFYEGACNNGPKINAAKLQNTLTAREAINRALRTQAENENLFVAYGPYQIKYGNFGLVGGVRVEKTCADSDADAKEIDTARNVLMTPIGVIRNYSTVFPSVRARHESFPGTAVCATFSGTFRRPGFNQDTSSPVVNPCARFVIQGTPDQQPTTAHSCVFSLDRYLSDSGILSVGVFDVQSSDHRRQQRARCRLRSALLARLRRIAYHHAIMVSILRRQESGQCVFEIFRRHQQPHYFV